MVSVGRLMADLMTILALGAYILGIVDVTQMDFLTMGTIEIFSSLSQFFLFALIVLLIVDFGYYGPKKEITAIVVAILSILATQNWIIGLIIGIINLALLSILGKIGTQSSGSHF